MASDIKLSTQDDLDVVWLQVVKGFEKETGSRLQPANGAVLSVSDVIDGIDPHKHVKESTKNKAIRVTQSILLCVQVFGGFVASAASGVFGPSQQCFSALNHVITTTQKYSEVFEDLTTLLERVSVFLETLSNYLDEGDAEVKLDKRLRPNVYRVLEHFLVILTLTTRLAKRRGKVRLFAKVFFTGDDEGVTAALTTLETRVVDVTRVQITTIGKDLSNAAREIRSMQGDIDAILKYDEENFVILKSLAATELSRASAEAIGTWLNLEDTQSWRYRHARLTEEYVPGTGSWLFEDYNFFKWKDPSSTHTKVVLITGNANRGKSCLTSAVVDHLQVSMETPGGPAHPLAYYYLQNVAHQGKGPPSISVALRSIVWQLGQLDRGYYAFLSRAYADGVGLQDATSVWSKLLAGYQPGKRTTFFVVLDGLDKSVAETLQTIVREAARECDGLTASHLQIRLFLSGSLEATSLLEDTATIYKIALDPGFDKEKMVANTEDVQELIRKRLGSMPVFRHDVTPFKKQQQQEIMHTLTVHIQNDFAALDLIFEELERCTNLGQLKEALEQVDEDMQVRFGRHIDSLNQSLSKHEILELNAIMACAAKLSDIRISGDIRGASIELVQEYVGFSLGTTRLVPLRQQIEHTYHSIFLITAEGVVSWRHEEFGGYLNERSEDERTVKKILAKRAKRPGLLDLEELDLLEKVVQTNFTHVFGAYGTELFNKYGFTEFFASKREPYKVWISYGWQECGIAALLVCLKIICEDPDAHHYPRLRVAALREGYYLLDGFRYYGGPTNTQEKTTLGRLLAKLLRNDGVIDAYYRNAPRDRRLFSHFAKKTEDSEDLVYQSLIDMEPDDLEDREGKEWLRTWKSGTGSCWDYISNRVICRWLKLGNDEWWAAKDFVDGFCVEEHYSFLCNKFANDGPETLQQITKLMFKKCGDNIQHIPTECDQVWMTRECDKILQVSDETWWAPFFTAKYLARFPCCPYFPIFSNGHTHKIEIQKAHDYLNVAISLELFGDEDYTRRYWHEMLLLFASCQVHLRDLAGAQKTYIRMMSSPESRQLLNFRLFSSLEPRMVMEILMVAKSVLVEPSGHNLFQQMMSGDLTANNLLPLRLAADSDCNWQYFVDLIEDSTLTGPSSQMLQSTMAHVLWHRSGDTQREDRALDIWKEGKETQAIVDALLGRAIKEVPHNPLESYSFQRLKRMHPGISKFTDDCDDNISFRSKLMVAGWRHQSGQVTEARQFISALLGHRHDVYSLDNKRRQRASMLEDWGLACIAFGDEDLGILLLEQVHLLRESIHVNHTGCRELCKLKTDITEQSNDRPILLCCKTCLAVVKPECRATVQRGVKVPGICELDHQYLPMRELCNNWGNTEENYDLPLYKDEYTGEYYTWSPENNGIDRAQQLYGWALPELIDTSAQDAQREREQQEYIQNMQGFFDAGGLLSWY